MTMGVEVRVVIRGVTGDYNSTSLSQPRVGLRSYRIGEAIATCGMHTP